MFSASEDQFKKAVKDSFKHLNQSVHSWEPVISKLNRKEQFMNKISIEKNLILRQLV